MGLGRVRIELKGVLKCVEGVGVILLAAVNDSQQVVTLHAGGIQGELLLDLLFCLGNRALLKEDFGLGERRGLLRRSVRLSRWNVGGLRCRVAKGRDEKYRERECFAQASQRTSGVAQMRECGDSSHVPYVVLVRLFSPDAATSAQFSISSACRATLC